MLTLPAKSTALVLIDLQKGILGNPLAPHAAPAVLEKASSLLRAFRERGSFAVVVNVRFSPDGADRPSGVVDIPMAGKSPPPADWADIHPDLHAEPADFRVTKHNWSALYGTELGTQLRRRGITTIVLAGVATNFGVESTARDAWHENYSVVIAEDACSAPAAELHTFGIEKILPRISRVRKTSEILESLRQS